MSEAKKYDAIIVRSLKRRKDSWKIDAIIESPREKTQRFGLKQMQKCEETEADRRSKKKGRIKKKKKKSRKREITRKGKGKKKKNGEDP